MADGIIFKASGTAVPPVGVELNTLRKGKLLTEYDVFAWDCMHPSCWPSQANPAASDPIYNLAGKLLDTPANNGAIGTGTALPTFDDGFIFASGSQATIAMNATVCKPATDSNGYIHMQWLLLRESTSARKIFGWGPSSGSMAYGVISSTTNRQYVIFADKATGLTTQTYTASEFPIDIGGVKYGLFLFCVGRHEDGAGGYVRRCRVYSKATGLVSTNNEAAGSTAIQGTGASAIGYSSAIGTNIDMRAYRGRHIDVGTASGVMTAGYFQTLCDDEFNGNKDRTDWTIS